MKKIYDKRFVYFEWDDRLVGKKVAYGDDVFAIKSNLENGNFVEVLKEGTVPGRPFRVKYEDGDVNTFRFVYYDPLLEYHIAYNAGKEVQYNDGDGWYPVYDGFCWDDEYRYCIVEETEVSKYITKRQLTQWLAQGNGEIMCEGADTMSVAFIYSLGEENEEVTGQFLVRKWTDTEWHEPTVGYCFPKQGGEK